MARNGDPWRDDKKMRLVLLFSRKREQCALDQMWEVSISECVCVCEWVWGRTNVWVSVFVCVSGCGGGRMCGCG